MRAVIFSCFVSNLSKYLEFLDFSTFELASLELAKWLEELFEVVGSFALDDEDLAWKELVKEQNTFRK